MNPGTGMRKFMFCLVLALGLAVSGWISAARVVAAEDSVSCTDCHDDKQNAKYVHDPAAEGECEACHEPTPEHLEDGGPGGMKTNRTAAACLQCHDPKDQGKNVHPALRLEGECVQCHNPHGADNEKFLVMPENKLCFSCHDPVPADANEGSEHSVVTDAKSCMNCHNPHSSDHYALLLNSTPAALCLGCHDRSIMVQEDGKVHEVKNRGWQVKHMPFRHEVVIWCTACHNAHGSKYRSLLVAAFPVENYNKYEPGEGKTKNTFELCFGCHRETILNETITPNDTGFRNDTIRNGVIIRENLHWFHVVKRSGPKQKNKGRSCIICHDVHGTVYPHIIRDSWPMDGHNLIMLFETRDNGGACLKSCHSLKSYQRID